jgi:hypothetical protein
MFLDIFPDAWKLHYHFNACLSQYVDVTDARQL